MDRSLENSKSKSKTKTFILGLFGISIGCLSGVLMVASSSYAKPSSFMVHGTDAPTYRILEGKGSARLLYNENNGSERASISILRLKPGAEVKEHIHEGSDEILYVENGRVEMVVGGKTFRAKKGDAIFIPEKVPHSAKVLGKRVPMRAVQVYVAPGPEQRFTKGVKISGN